MLTVEQKAEIKQEFIDTLKTLTRADADVDGLIAYLEATDFFDAPASTQYHCSFPGGLCLHSLNVYKAIKSLASEFCEGKYSNDSLIIVGLLHDLGKINFYEPAVRNVKVYSAYGKKEDELGFFDWKTECIYAVKDVNNRDVIGTKGFTAYYIASMFIPLTKEEMITLTNQYSALEREPLPDLSNVLGKYGLTVLLHASDIISTYCIEK